MTLDRMLLMRSVVVLMAATTVAGCVTPATGAASYRGKARSSVQAAMSETQTARITLGALQNDRIFTTTADEAVTAAETALGSISAAFGSVQPPPGSDRVRGDTMRLLSESEDALGAARIAIRRSDRAGAEVALRRLVTATERLERAKQRLS